MAVYYANGNEICIGDAVVGVGICDHRDLTGLVGEVITLERYPGQYSYACEVDFGNWTWWVYARNIMPKNTVNENGTPTCLRCGREITTDMRLGMRLHKKALRCDECIADEVGKVHNYHFSKALDYKMTLGKITLGAEIEIDDPDNEGDRDATIRDLMRYARTRKYPLIMTHEDDGSLSDSGFENVTVPLTLDEWKSDAVLGQLATLFESAENNGYYLAHPHSHAGLHVHIGRKDLCGDDKKKSDAVGLLMGWAVARLWDSGFNRLSRRDCLDYCHLYDEEIEDPNGLYDTEYADDRYGAVNIQNSKTIELRIFSGASSVDDVILAVDMCYMLAKWATKKINAYGKRKTYSARGGKYDDALEYADRLTWSALAKYSKFPEITLKRMRECNIDF